MKGAFLALLRSRKFLVAVLDVIFSLTLFFVGKYALPTIFEDVQIVIGAMQPVALFLIGAIAYEDGQEKRSGMRHEL